MKTTIIFDMDGVIIDSEPIHRAVSKKYFSALNVLLTDAEYETFVGASAKDNLAYIKNNYTVEPTIEKMIDDLRSNYQQHLKAMPKLPMIAGARNLIDSLQKANYPLLLASSANRLNINLVLERFGLTDTFLHKISGAELPNSKPNPAIFLKAAELGKVSPENCLVIEDSHHGVTAAKAAGMCCIGYQNPNSGNQDLSHADRVVHQMRDVTLEVIEGLMGDN